MLRHGLRRCASQAAARAASASILPRSRATLLPVASLCRHNVLTAIKASPLSHRSYSSEAAAVDGSNAQDSASGEITEFEQLLRLGVHPNLLSAITRDMNYQTMTPVQAKTIPPALKGTDIVAQAKTGTGKTLAFLVPLLQRMIAEDPSLASRDSFGTARSNDIRGIVLSPTRELAEQIATEARRLTRPTGLVVQSAVGGTQKAFMLRQTQRQGCHLLVATPGRLNDLLRDPQSGIDAPKLAALVLDEADRMLDVGFEQELREIIGFLPSPNEKVRQTMLVSATIPDNVIRLARQMIRPDDFQFVQTIGQNESLTHDRVPQHIVAVRSWGNVFPTLFELIDREVEAFRSGMRKMPFKAIVYFNTTALVELAADVAYMRRRTGQMKASSFAIHSKLQQMSRTRAADSFRNSGCAVLFSSDVTARGMDFPNVSHVIQIDTPRDRESYIHRLGRTARGDKEGEGWMLAPQVSIGSTKRLLDGLPLQPNDTLTAAGVKLDAGESSPFHEQMTELGRDIMSCFNAAYKSVFGLGTSVARDKSSLVDDLNLWAIKGFGYSEPPAVGNDWARQLGLSNTNLNFYRGRGFSGGGASMTSAFPSRGGDSSDFSSDNGGGGDAFSEMGRQIRRDDSMPRRFDRGGGRGGGYGDRGDYGNRRDFVDRDVNGFNRGRGRVGGSFEGRPMRFRENKY
ncbi:hypothetical protein XA68_18518 [Ophiocordyceps unilateralis]|uniref:ATP-dependent RNA helicase n=1 Tax=Ophiocordyceps unilateralis TaxID=268505 RepID=A0A2A9PJ84_OPHUN|nr:hypothetical protein XA68_18518 [Ophiocordyceps unilateralis]